MDSSKNATKIAAPKADSAFLNPVLESKKNEVQKIDSATRESDKIESKKAESKSLESKRIIACDVGLKRIGVAIYLQGIALPLPAIFRKNRNQAARDLSNLLREQNADMLIVGLPMSEKARKIEEMGGVDSSANTSAPQKLESKSADVGKVDFVEANSIKADSKEMDFAKEADFAKQDSIKIDSSKPESAQDDSEAMVRRIRHFVSLLEFEKPIVYVDEGYSSHIASERLAHLAREDKARAHKDGRIDSLAACEILSRYISHHTKLTTSTR